MKQWYKLYVMYYSDATLYDHCLNIQSLLRVRWCLPTANQNSRPSYILIFLYKQNVFDKLCMRLETTMDTKIVCDKRVSCKQTDILANEQAGSVLVELGGDTDVSAKPL